MYTVCKSFTKDIEDSSDLVVARRGGYRGGGGHVGGVGERLLQLLLLLPVLGATVLKPHLGNGEWGLNILGGVIKLFSRDMRYAMN